MLTDSFLNALIAELDDAETVAIALFGSHARGQATRYSDVDLVHFVATLPEEESERYTLWHRENHLISISVTTIAAKREDLSKPQKAIWAVPALRQARILLDKEGSLGKLKQDAVAFSWQLLQRAADKYASYTAMGYAEEVHKILSGLVKRDESAIANGTLGLVLGMTQAIAVQRGILIESENSYFRQVQETVGLDSAWTHWYRLAAGFEPGSIEKRGIAGLELYRETAHLLRDILRPAHRDVINHTLDTISRANFSSEHPTSRTNVLHDGR